MFAASGIARKKISMMHRRRLVENMKWSCPLWSRKVWWSRCHRRRGVNSASPRPASRCGTVMWPDLRLKWPQVDHHRLDHIRLDFTWQWHVTWVDFKRLQKRDSEWNTCHYQKLCMISGQPGRKNGVSFNEKILKIITIIDICKTIFHCRLNPCQCLICDAANRNTATQTISLQHLPH